MDATASLPCRSQADVPSGRLRADPSSLEDVLWKVLLDTAEYLVIDKVRTSHSWWRLLGLLVRLACLQPVCYVPL